MSDDNLTGGYVTSWRSGLPETPCGRGSMVAQTAIIQKFLPRMAKKYNIETVNDVGCGDQNWIHLVDWDVVYDGYDVLPRNDNVIKHDVVKDTLPYADLVLCICVLNHLRLRDDFGKALKKIKKSGSKYLIMNYCADDSVPFKVLDKVKLKDTGRHVWYYGLMDLGNA